MATKLVDRDVTQWDAKVADGNTPTIRELVGDEIPDRGLNIWIQNGTPPEGGTPELRIWTEIGGERRPETEAEWVYAMAVLGKVYAVYQKNAREGL